MANGGGLCWGLCLLSLASLAGSQPQRVPTHRTGNWRRKKDYLLKYAFTIPGTNDAAINSCSIPNLSQDAQCNGKGQCMFWKPEEHDDVPAKFCVCDRDWADPECSTPRKSQRMAFLLSLFLGATGADQFYLGFHHAGFVKLSTFGGFGFWWAYDVMRIGSAPVESSRFRTAADLPHGVFCLIAISYMMTIGWCIVYWTTLGFRAQKRRYAMQTIADEEIPRDVDGMPGMMSEKEAHQAEFPEFGGGGCKSGTVPDRKIIGAFNGELDISSKYDAEHPDDPLYLNKGEASRKTVVRFADYGATRSDEAPEKKKDSYKMVHL